MLPYKRILAIINPASGPLIKPNLDRMITNFLAEEGRDFEIRQTKDQGDAQLWSRTARAEGFDLVAVAGGDGTIREALEGLMRSGGQLPLAQIPMGTTNVTARALGIPTLDLKKAIALMTRGKCVRFDVGYLPEHDRYFAFVCGAGYDAQLIHGTSREMKKNLGFLAYVWTGIKHVFTTRPVRVRLEIDGEVQRIQAHTIMAVNIGNLQDIRWSLAPGIDPHDGKFNIVVMSSRSVLGNLVVLAKVITKRYYGYADLKHMSGRTIRVVAEPPLPFQIDGEALGTTPFLAEIIPGGMQYIVPIDYPE